MKAFIESRKREPFIKDQLHAVWLCVQVPLPGFGERLIETNAEQFWREKKEVLGDIPTIVVFTKYDRLITKMRVDNAASTESDARQYLQNKCIAPIQKLSGEKNISHVAVSLNKGYEQGQKDLVQLTFDKVSEHFVPQLNTPSPVPVVTSMAQRMLPRPKIDGSIQVGKQIWNFHDPSGYLASEMLRMYMLDMIKDIGDIGPPETSPEPDHDFITEQCGPSFIFLPITMPLVAGAALISWVHETYQRVPNVQQKFMAYIVDLTHVLEILFELTADNSEKKLTRRSIKVAYKAYLQSSLKRAVHSDVRDFHGIGAIIGGRDLILEKIESLLQTSYTSDVPLAQLVSTVPRASLDMDEEWGTI
ncbi:hypothetical protein ID866_4774 [Astraeus odoratus]|nr:hypothetical protein ID866_4774 [Astraeus odoratus]